MESDVENQCQEKIIMRKMFYRLACVAWVGWGEDSKCTKMNSSCAMSINVQLCTSCNGNNTKHLIITIELKSSCAVTINVHLYTVHNLISFNNFIKIKK